MGKNIVYFANCLFQSRTPTLSSKIRLVRNVQVVHHSKSAISGTRSLIQQSTPLCGVYSSGHVPMSTPCKYITRPMTHISHKDEQHSAAAKQASYAESVPHENKTASTNHVTVINSEGQRSNAKVEGNDWKIHEVETRVHKQLATKNDAKPEVTVVPYKFMVQYIDTGAEWDAKKKLDTPTLLLLHGISGTHRELLPIAEKIMVERGYRVIIPNLPGEGLTKPIGDFDDVQYGHGPTETAQFLSNFLDNLGVKRLDSVLGFSGGCYPLTLLASTSPLVKSVAYISSSTGHKRMDLIKPVWLFKFNIWCLQFRMLGSPLIRLMEVMIRGRNSSQQEFPNILIAHLVMSNVDHDRNQGHAKQIGKLKCLPLLFICGSRDIYLKKEESLGWAKCFGLEEECFDQYDKQGYLSSKGSKSDLPYAKGVMIDTRLHYLMRSEEYNQIICNELLAMVDHTLSQDKTTSGE